MTVLIDTNVLVSAALFPDGLAKQAFVAAIEGGDEAIVCDYSIAELHEVFRRKFPDRLHLLPRFMAYLSSGVTIVSTPNEPTADEPIVRDPKDQPILSAARAADADLILTGDKDLLDAHLDWPTCVNPRGFLAR